MRPFTIGFLTCLLQLLFIGRLSAGVRLPRLVGDHMVLQRERPIPVWGWADPGERITVSFAGKTVTAKTGPDTKWRLDLPTMAAGGPYTMTVQGKKNAIIIRDILICGISNSCWAMRAARPPKSIPT